MRPRPDRIRSYGDEMDRISLWELNRTFLLRQHLVGGAAEDVTDVVGVRPA
jgi:hypothetical protein